MGRESGFEYGKQIRSLVYSYNALDNVQYRRSISLRYDANGNISFKSDVGDYDCGEAWRRPPRPDQRRPAPYWL
ncbi:hypothetical protein [Candidatus Endoriftia persephonae]|jgi:hypothetical protein|uniref:Uncharacterized protein n=2 Tax=Gammaproteobacteria TaxID=1236 RepID=G2FE49_9GAMM|nr:hypothetical protein [Candidatus Endoriftia persephone]EGW55033.1 hypothetical protein TevJSym_ag01110 [endosymbiont of Tevnia jerichonana (vent Tica)]USF87816.1 cyclic nucleotide-binding protein [Candidatus Endoriftia persephone]